MRNERMVGGYTSEDMRVDGRVLRRCVYCGEWKSLDTEYARNGSTELGEPAYRRDCKTCYNIRRNENRTKKKHTDFIGGQKRRGEVDPQLSHQEWKECVIFFGGECAYCGATPRKGQRLTRDHLHPMSDGGATTQDNIVPACRSCNSSKGAEDFKDWFMKQAFFSQERLNKIFKWRTMLRMIGEDLER